MAMNQIRICLLVDPTMDQRHISEVVGDHCYYGEWNDFEWWKLGEPEAGEPDTPAGYQSEELETEQGGFIINWAAEEAPMDWFLTVSRKYPTLNCWMDMDNKEARTWHRWEASEGIQIAYTHSEPMKAI